MVIQVTEYCNTQLRKFPANPLEVFKSRVESSIKISSNKVLQRDKGTELHKPLKVPSSSNSAKASSSNSFQGFPNANCYDSLQLKADPPPTHLNVREEKLLLYGWVLLVKTLLSSLENSKPMRMSTVKKKTPILSSCFSFILAVPLNTSDNICGFFPHHRAVL